MIPAARRGDVWWAEAAGKRRPFVVLTRDAAIPVLNAVLAAPITRTRRPIPTHVTLDQDDGMPTECAVSLDNVTAIDKSLLSQRQTRLSPARMAEVCDALAAAVECR